MDKIIGMGNALVDVLVTLQDDSLLDEMSLPKGSMQLINEDKFLKISGKYSGMKTHKATGGSAGNTVLALANLGAHPGFIGKIGNDDFGQYFKKNGLKQGIDMKLPFFLKYCPKSSFPIFPINPGCAPRLANAKTVFPALPPVALCVFIPEYLPLIFKNLSSFISCMLPLGKLISSSSESSCKVTRTSTNALPIPIILSIYLKFFCKDIAYFGKTYYLCTAFE